MARVIVGLSGGVDSSVAALLLMEKGYEVIGMTVETCLDPQTPWEIEEIAAARRVAEHLGIPFITVSARDAFERKVVQPFISEWFSGRTPNPCIVCNHYIKWASLLTAAKEQGADAVATGHYARIEHLPDGRSAPARAKDARKDQSYVLFMLSQEALSKTILPVGEYEKPQIREIAARAGLPSAHTPDSQDICFVSNNDYVAFLTRRAPERMPGPGKYVSVSDGEVLGEHKGYVHYTVGQRKGLGIACGKPMYVTAVRPEDNTVLLDENDVYGSTLTCDGLRCSGISEEALAAGGEITCIGKVRYAHAGAPCRIRKTAGDTLEVRFDAPVRAITPGQAAVFYDENGIVLLGGWIR